MTKKELRELVKSVIKEYMGTGSSGGQVDKFSSSPRIGGTFLSDEDELEFYNNQNAGDGGQGHQTKGMEVTNMGNPNRTRFTRF